MRNTLNLVANGGVLYPVSTEDISLLRSVGFMLTKLTPGVLEAIKALHPTAFNVVVHSLRDVLRQLLTRMNTAMQGDEMFQSVEWAPGTSEWTAYQDADLRFFVQYQGGLDDSILQGLLEAGAAVDASAPDGSESDSPLAAADQYVSSLSRYVARYNIKLNVTRKLRPEEGGVAFRLLFEENSGAPNATYYDEDLNVSTSSHMYFSPFVRLSMKIDTPHAEVGALTASNLGPILHVSLETLCANDWVPSGTLMRSFPVERLDRDSVSKFIDFLASNLL